VVDAVAAQHQAMLGIVVKDLASGDTARLNDGSRFSSASLYKLFVMQAVADQIKTGSLGLNDMLTVSAEVVAADPYADLPVGTRTSVDCALQAMLEESGNTAADLLIDHLGLDAINAHMVELGLTQSITNDDTAFTSPADVARLLESLAHDAVSNKDPVSARMLDMLAHQQHSDRLPVPLPMNVRVAHKTGELPNLRHDAGIVYAPGGAYLFVAMVQSASSESAARTTIVDLSQAVYAALQPTGVTLYQGLPPRLAREIFDVPDAQGRMELLVDPRTQTEPVAAPRPSGSEPPRLRSEALPDLVALQAEAAQQGVPFAVIDGLRYPTDARAAQVQPTAYVAPCAMEIPGPGKALRYGQPPTSAQSIGLKQQWLGTVAVVGDAQGRAFSSSESETPTGQWLLTHAWEHGFISAPPETEAGMSLGHEPWTLRWVGHEMAATLHAQGATGKAAEAALGRARTDLGSPPGLDSLTQGPDSQGVPCWATSDRTTQGCPARWFFSPST
jgi:beta-lactamase class A